MEETKIFFFIFSLILSLFLAPTQITGKEDLVQKVCQKTLNKANCVTTFKLNPDSKNATLRQLGIIALKTAAKNATDTSEYIEKALNATNLEPETQQGLSDCLEQYIDANEQIDNSVAALLSKADKDIRTWLNAALAGVKSCDDGFGKNVKSKHGAALKKRNADFTQLCNNALVVSKLLSEEKKKN
ncbi:hypothetical protein M5689_004346 [Euphorbia peplus]|nr:hypothetical protein M5689_004346 [Euphorbia peplus]